MRKIEAVEDINQASDEYKQEKIRLWADRLEKHPSTIERYVRKANGPDGLAALVRTTRSDAGKVKGSKRWKHSIQYWTEFILKTYNDGTKAKLGMTPNLVNNQVVSHAELELGLKQGEYPSHPFVYKILEPLIEKKNRKVRNQVSRGFRRFCFVHNCQYDRLHHHRQISDIPQLIQIHPMHLLPIQQRSMRMHLVQLSAMDK